MIVLLFFTLYTMAAVRRRKEWFFILTPLFFVISSSSGLANSLIEWNKEDEWNRTLDCLSRQFDIMAHWIFSAQYLRTCLVLPILFIEAKLEWVMDDAQSNKIGANAPDWNKLQNELAKHGSSNEISSVDQTFLKFDMVIREQKKAVQRINRDVLLITVGITLYIFGLVAMYFELLFVYYVIFEAIIIIFINATLIYAVYYIHKTI